MALNANQTKPSKFTVFLVKDKSEFTSVYMQDDAAAAAWGRTAEQP
jgi:hypothetical protein